MYTGVCIYVLYKHCVCMYVSCWWSCFFYLSVPISTVAGLIWMSWRKTREYTRKSRGLRPSNSSTALLLRYSGNHLNFHLQANVLAITRHSLGCAWSPLKHTHSFITGCHHEMVLLSQTQTIIRMKSSDCVIFKSGNIISCIAIAVLLLVWFHISILCCLSLVLHFI